MFDLVDECGKELEKGGYKVKSLYGGKLSHAKLVIDSKQKSKEFGLDEGEYHVFNFPSLYDDYLANAKLLQQEFVKILKKLLNAQNYKKKDGVLIVGLGNSEVECDRLGKEAFDRIDITPLNRERKIFKFCPNIFFLTGINAIDLVKMLVEKFNITLVLLIDSLTTGNLSRLGTSFQVTTSGITPGSGVNRFGKKIAKEEICAKTISIGVPFMINSSSFVKGSDIFLCSKDISSNIALAGRIIAESVNEVLK